MTYDDMAEWLDENIEPSDYESFEDYATAIQNEFGVSSEIAKALAKPFWDEFLEDLAEQTTLEDFVEPEPEKPKPKPKEKPKKVKLTKSQETDIENVVQNEDLTKREVSIRTLEIVNKPFSLQQFYDETGMIQSTARRELGQAVKRGEIERVSRGVYRRL